MLFSSSCMVISDFYIYSMSQPCHSSIFKKHAEILYILEYCCVRDLMLVEEVHVVQGICKDLLVCSLHVHLLYGLYN